MQPVSWVAACWDKAADKVQMALLGAPLKCPKAVRLSFHLEQLVCLQKPCWKFFPKGGRSIQQGKICLIPGVPYWFHTFLSSLETDA